MCINNCQLIAGSLCPFFHSPHRKLSYLRTLLCTVLLCKSLFPYNILLERSTTVRALHSWFNPNTPLLHNWNNEIIVIVVTMALSLNIIVFPVQFLTIGSYLKDHTPRCLMKTIIYLLFRIIGLVPFSAVKTAILDIFFIFRVLILFALGHHAIDEMYTSIFNLWSC